MTWANIPLGQKWGAPWTQLCVQSYQLGYATIGFKTSAMCTTVL